MAELKVTDETEPVDTTGALVTAEKVAVTLRLEFMVTWQVVEVPEQAPDHPLNTELAAGEAVKVTTVPAEKDGPRGVGGDRAAILFRFYLS